MDALQLTITDAGLAALVDNENSGTEALRITEIGISENEIVVAPTLEALPGEIKRIDTISGETVAIDTIHMTARDTSADLYDARAIGLYLEDGTLLAVYGGADPIFGKSALSTFLLALDIKFLPEHVEQLSFGDANFSYPPATETVRGVARLADLATAQAGVDGETIIPPSVLKQLLDLYVAISQKGVANGVASLGADGKVPVAQLPPFQSRDTFVVASQAAMLALAADLGDFAVRTDENKNYVLSAEPATVLGNWTELLTPGAPVQSVNGKVGAVVINAADVGAPPTARTITGTGLATGGGALDQNRAINVAAASDAEAVAALITNKAVVPANLAQIFAQLAGRVPTTRTVTGTGLAAGTGGSLANNITIGVIAAIAAEMISATANDRAVTPLSLPQAFTRVLGNNGYIQFPGQSGDRLLLQWGRFTAAGGIFTTVSLPLVFPTQFFGVIAGGTSEANNNAQDNWPAAFGHPDNLGTFRVYSANNQADACFFIALGK